MAFVVYRYLGHRIARLFFPEADIRHQRLIGALSLGLVPTMVLFLSHGVDVREFGLALPTANLTALLCAGTLLIALPLIYRQAQTPSYQDQYPELRGVDWTRSLQLRNAISWGAYLFAYELLFRGLLLMSLFNWLGTWPAITIMAAMYVLSHVDKSADETFGTIPMSIVFAFAALSTESIYLPWLMHWAIAVASDTFAMRASAKV